MTSSLDKKKSGVVLAGGSQMLKLNGPVRGGIWMALGALLLSATMSSAQVQSLNCKDLYGAIKTTAMHCGFFCDQGKLQPLQAAYGSQCIASVIPASVLGFDSSPGPAESAEAHSAAQLQPAAFVPAGPHNSRQLLDTMRGVRASLSASRAQRTQSAEAFLGYCKSALARVPNIGLHVGLTEQTGDRSGAQLEYDRWQLTTIFADCTEAAHEILDAQDAQQEAAAWLKLTQLLGQDEAVRKLSANAELLRHRRNRTETDDIFGTDNWRTMQAITFDVGSTLRAGH